MHHTTVRFIPKTQKRELFHSPAGIRLPKLRSLCFFMFRSPIFLPSCFCLLFAPFGSYPSESVSICVHPWLHLGCGFSALCCFAPLWLIPIFLPPCFCLLCVFCAFCSFSPCLSPRRQGLSRLYMWKLAALKNKNSRIPRFVGQQTWFVAQYIVKGCVVAALAKRNAQPL